MNPKTRLEKLEAAAPRAIPAMQLPYTFEELAAMPMPDLIRLTREHLSAPTAPQTPDEKRRQREYSEHLKTLSGAQLERLYRAKIGEFAEIKRQW